jgi:5-methylcytosine-specific restriction endonuclease McrA/energy-coupling factor transporter ATP-binding protein EcfA2
LRLRPSLTSETILQRFDRRRVPVPDVFGSPRAQRYRNDLAHFFLTDPEKRAQTRAPAPGSWLYAREVHASLKQLFNGKCAYCELRISTEMDHFRPTAEAVPRADAATSHLYYAWLAGAWDNLYPACPSCNRMKSNVFPVDGKRMGLPSAARLKEYVARRDGAWGPLGKEDNLVLDPCRDRDFHEHLGATPHGELVERSKYGFHTIKTFGLNRPDLVSRRADSVTKYATALRNTSGSYLARFERRSEVLDFQQLEFGGFWYLLLRGMAAKLMDEDERATMLTPENIGVFLVDRPKRDYLLLFTREHGARAVRKTSTSAARPAPPAPDPPVAVPRRIQRVQIRNFKALDSIGLNLRPAPADAQREPALLILGENAAGKSSILEALALALCGTEERDALKLTSHELMLNEECMGGREDVLRPATVSVEFDGGDAVTFKAQRKGVSIDGPSPGIPVFAYGAFRQYCANEEPSSGARRIVSLFDPRAIQANPERWLLGLSKDDFYQVARALREIFSIQQKFELIERQPKKGRCVLVGGPTKNAGRTPLSQASSGFRSILGMVCEVMQGLLEKKAEDDKPSLATAHAVVLIDEVEAHLHPRWKMQIMTGLRRALPKVTFIATTHDPLCLRGMDQGEAVVVRRVSRTDSRHRVPEHVELLEALPDLTQLSVEQLLTSDFFGLFSTEDPELERTLDEYADLLTQGQHARLTARARKVLAPLELALAGLPIGGTAAEQLIEQTILEYLVNRRGASLAKLDALTTAAKESIVKALEGI